MVTPRIFREDDPEILHAFAARHSFATMIVVKANGEPEIAHVPVVVDHESGGTRLRLHVAMANPIWRAALSAGRVTFVFSGPHAYVSARWYETPTEQVPTWNYAVVHAQGTPERMDASALLQLLDDLVAIHEGDAADAWRTSLLSPAFRDELRLEIVGLSVRVTTFEGKMKLSQNRSPADQARVAERLLARDQADDRAVAELMTERRR